MKMEKVLWLNDFGIEPDTQIDAQPAVCRLIESLNTLPEQTNLTIRLKPGRYDFYPEHAFKWKGGISNHHQETVRNISFLFKQCKSLIFDGGGAELIFHYRCLPFAMIDTDGCILRNFSIDYEHPVMRQLAVTEIAADGNSMKVIIEPSAEYRIENGHLRFPPEQEEDFVHFMMTFEPSGRLASRIVDHSFDPKMIEDLGGGCLRLVMPSADFHPGHRLVLRPSSRPNPALFLYRANHSRIENVNVHFAQGIGVLAQMTEDVTLDGFKVCRRSQNDPRLFTLHADATHFSGCRGTIRVENCCFEGMADDAINVHGTYLGVVERLSDRRLRCRFMHPASRGFGWGQPGNEVVFTDSASMEYLPGPFTISRIQTIDGDADGENATEFLIDFNKSLPKLPNSCGLENLSWTPEVIFRHNLIRNNRARGALFSTPKKIVCEDNVFDHTHGTAILLCGDCNGWYESGACHDVTICRNHFINPLTALYEFSEAIISICPAIPSIEQQKKYFHSGIRIIDNDFDYFDEPILFAKSAEGIEFVGNRIHRNRDYPPYHPNRAAFRFEHCQQVQIDPSNFGRHFDPVTDLSVIDSPDDAVTFLTAKNENPPVKSKNRKR
jgi:hypothetical protein